jgi:hypothetical protein
MAQPFSLVQAGAKLYALTLDGTTALEITLPNGVTINPNFRVRAAVLNRKIVISGTPGISEPIWIYPLTLAAYPMRVTAPTAPVLTGGAAGGPFYGWVSFIQKIGTEVVNESALSPASVQSTSAIFTDIDTSGQSFVTGRRLYRSVADGTIPFAAHDIDDNSTTSYDTNSITDADLALNASDPSLGPIPSDADLIVAWRDRLWVVSRTEGSQDRIYFTEVGQHYAFAATNFLLAQPLGEDDFGVTGFIPRRDELGVTKRNRVLKVIGTGIDADFDVVGIVDGIGCVSPDSIVVIRDIGHFLGLDGTYALGPQGVTPTFDQKVVPWFQTDTYFNRDEFRRALGGYNPFATTYDLHLCVPGETTLTRWVSLDIKRQEWTGPHKTGKFTPSARGLLRSAESQYLPTMGSADGFLYKMNQAGASDEGTAIAIDWVHAYLSANAPDIFHRWLQGSILIAIQAGATAPLVITPYVGEINAGASAAINVSQLVGRTKLPRFGAGRLLKLQFTHSTNAEDVLIYAIEIPFNEVGRR